MRPPSFSTTKRWLARTAGFGGLFGLLIACPAQEMPPMPKLIVCLGDSITDGDTYPQIVMQSLHEAGSSVPACVCSGVGGDTARMMDARFDQTVARFKPEMVTFNAGTNDAFQNVPPEEYEKSVRSIVAKAKALGARVMLLTPSECLARNGKTEADKEASFQKVQATLDAYEAVIRTVAADSGCLLAENRKRMKESLQAGNSLFVEDNTHPNYLGQSLIARSVLDALGYRDVALPARFDPKEAPGLVKKWRLRFAPLDKGQPVPLTDEAVAKLRNGAEWIPCELPEKEALADSPEMWPEQMRRTGALMKSERVLGKGALAQGVAEIASPEGGPAFIQTGMGVADVWLNGAKIHDQMKAWTGAHPGKERLPVTLVKGTNTIVIEFNQSFFLSVTPSLIWEDRLY